MDKTLNEIILMNDNLTGCLPVEIGKLGKVTVFDVSFNGLQGPLPDAVGQMKSLEQLDVAHNRLTGVIPASVCQLPKLQNFTYSYNYFTGEAPQCKAGGGGRLAVDGRKNCIAGKKEQRSAKECSSEAAKPVDCRKEDSQCPAGHRSGSSWRRSSPPAPVVTSLKSVHLNIHMKRGENIL